VDFKILLSVVFVFFILNEVSIISKDVFELNIVWFKSFPWFIAYFILGYYLDQFFSHKVIKNRVVIVSLIGLVMIGVYLNYHFYITQNILRDSLVLGSTGPFVFLISALVFILVRQNAVKFQENKMVSQISDTSFGMYLIHPVIIYTCVHNLPNYSELPLLYMPLVILVTILMSFTIIFYMRKLSIFRLVS
jgi:surface polysaccharide O-acyltransferase-like enzyme